MEFIWWVNQGQNQNCAILGYRSVHQPGFVWSVELDSNGLCSCTHDPLLAQEVSFPTSTHTHHLEVVCPVKRPKNRRYLFPGQNPAKVWLRLCLDDLLNSIFCETLGHENTSKYLSNQCPKVELRDQPILLLSSQKDMRNSFTRF